MIVDFPHVGQNLQDHPVISEGVKLRDDTGHGTHICYAGPEYDAAVTSYKRTGQDRSVTALFELVAIPRIDQRLETYESYRGAKARCVHSCSCGVETDGQVLL